MEIIRAPPAHGKGYAGHPEELGTTNVHARYRVRLRLGSGVAKRRKKPFE
jgi:hypothetical protein